jgi:hypothetical protein
VIAVAGPVLRPVRKALNWFNEQVDSETVRLFVWPYYFGLLAFDLLAFALIPLDNPLSQQMGRVHYLTWLSVMLTGITAVLLGLVLRHGGRPIHKMTLPFLFADWMGLCLQAGGHLCMFWVLLDFEIELFQLITWWTDVVRIFAWCALSPYVMGCLWLAYGVARKLQQGERLHQRTKDLNDGRGLLNGPA